MVSSADDRPNANFSKKLRNYSILNLVLVMLGTNHSAVEYSKHGSQPCACGIQSAESHYIEILSNVAFYR